MEHIMPELNFRCCFCNEMITPNDVDPCDVNILTNIDKPKDKQENQTFYCHIDCFKEKMHYKMAGFLIIDEPE